MVTTAALAEAAGGSAEDAMAVAMAASAACLEVREAMVVPEATKVALVACRSRNHCIGRRCTCADCHDKHTNPGMTVGPVGVELEVTAAPRAD